MFSAPTSQAEIDRCDKNTSPPCSLNVSPLNIYFDIPELSTTTRGSVAATTKQVKTR